MGGPSGYQLRHICDLLVIHAIPTKSLHRTHNAIITDIIRVLKSADGMDIAFVVLTLLD